MTNETIILKIHLDILNNYEERFGLIYMIHDHINRL
jgi:hypothetical protein